MKPLVIPPAGYRLDLGGALAGALHADGSLSIEHDAGQALDFDPSQVEKLAELLALGGGLRGQARRRRARRAYLDTYAPDQ